MNEIENRQSHFDVSKQEKINLLQFEETRESRERVWKNLEKILDRFEQDLTESKQELKVITEEL